MVCFYHPDKPAFGLCKYCSRGLCSDCAMLVDDVLACRDRHEEIVRELNLLAQRNMLQAKRVSSNYMRNTIFYGSIGVLFIVFGALQLQWLGLHAIVYLMIGLALLWAALANYLGRAGNINDPSPALPKSDTKIPIGMENNHVGFGEGIRRTGGVATSFNLLRMSF